MSTGGPDYFKRTLLYGLYEGAATPLACDEQGRLIFIPESVSPLDKSGTIVLRDDFTNGFIHTVTSTDGTGASVALDGTEAKRGGYSAKLTGGSDGLRKASLLYQPQYSGGTKFGLEFYIRWGNYVKYLFIWLSIYDGAERHMAFFQFDVVDYAWEAYDYATTSWKTVRTYAAFVGGAHKFNLAKFVIDLAGDAYHTFRDAQGSVDLSAYAISAGANTAPPHVEITISLQSQVGENGVVLIDDVIFTQDES